MKKSSKTDERYLIGFPKFARCLYEIRVVFSQITSLLAFSYCAVLVTSVVGLNRTRDDFETGQMA